VITGTTKWYQVAVALRTAAEAGLSNAVSRSAIVPGLIAWDGCDCGALYVSVGMVVLSEIFPGQKSDVTGGSCGPPWEVAEVTVQILRCDPQPQGAEDFAPPVAELETAALLVRTDAAEVLTAVGLKLCQMRDETSEIIDYIIDTQSVSGPQGACVGTELKVRVGLPRG
jgi:hypothetical protein